MGKFPVMISEEENEKLAHPFLPYEQYESIHSYSDGATVIVKRSGEKLLQSDIALMVRLNRDIAARRLFNENEAKKKEVP